MSVRLVGQPLKRLEDPKLITGSDPYVADVWLENALSMAVVRSPYAHAEIKAIDASTAKTIPGVVAVFTGRDLNAQIGVMHEVSDVVVGEDGRVTVLTGSASHGQGHETVFAQIVADELQVPIDLVTVVHGDTERVRHGVGTFGSRSMARGGMHALGNAIKVREKAKQIAASLLEAAPEDIVHEDGSFHVRGVPDRGASWREVAAAAKGQLASREDRGGTGTLFPFGAHVALVEVDRDTGQVRLLRYVSVDDSGFLVNPLLAQGQVHGGLAQGIGQALWEGAAFDENGQLLTSTLMDYALPKSDEFPSFETDHTRTLSPRTALGVKGIGESATIGSTPAIANAVMDALKPLGIKHLDLPLTPAKIWTAISAATKR